MKPALLVTTRTDDECPELIKDDDQFIVVCTPTELKNVTPDAGATLLSRGGKRIKIGVDNIDALDLSTEASEAIAKAHLTTAVIRAIGKADPGRLEELLGASLNIEMIRRWSNVDPTRLMQLAALTRGIHENVGPVVVTRSEFDPGSIRAALRCDPKRIAQVADILRELDPGLESVIRGREPAAAQALSQLLGDDLWKTLEEGGAKLPEMLAHRRVWHHRRQDWEQFRDHLRADDWTETEWEDFFKQRTWIFGYGLNYQFLHCLQKEPYLGGKDITGTGGQKSDFLMTTAAKVRFTVLVEIKTPSADLTLRQKYRNRTHKLGDDLTNGVAQLQQQRWSWEVVDSRLDQNRDLLEGKRIFTHEPKGILVIGNLASLQDSRDRLYTFESFRRNLWQPEILTYDELLNRAEHIVMVGESESSRDSKASNQKAVSVPL